MELIRRRIYVVSTCEELSYPWWHHPKESAALDAAAKEAGVRVIGTGVNPGFAMDLLPLILTAVSASVELGGAHCGGCRQTAWSAAEKGWGRIAPEEFAVKKATGRFGHVGLAESVAFLAHGLGWELVFDRN